MKRAGLFVLNFPKSAIGRYLTLLILLVPLFFINIKPTHDWGDDFAQYIHQAINMVEGIPQSRTGYIFNPDHPYLGPPVYSVGFPLLLAPIYALFGNNIVAFSYFNTLLLCCLVLVCFSFFRSYFSEIVSLLLCLALAYNPWTLNFKMEILSDIAFSLVFMMCLITFLKYKEKEKPVLLLTLGFLLGFLLLVKNTGIILLGAILLDFFVSTIKKMRNKAAEHNLMNAFSRVSVLLILVLVMHFAVNYLLFPVKDVTFSYFKSLYANHWSYEKMLSNASYYLTELEYFFSPPMQTWGFVVILIKSFALALGVMGFLISIRKHFAIPEMVVTGYLITILVFPNSTQGFRYLFPILPLIGYYLLIGLRAQSRELKFSKDNLSAGFLIIILLTYYTGVSSILKSKYDSIPGPYEQEATEIFTYLKANTPENDTIVFIKPRALALFTGRNSFATSPAADSLMVNRNLTQFSYSYILLTTDIGNSPLEKYIKKNSQNFICVFDNVKFSLWKKLK